MSLGGNILRKSTCQNRPRPKYAGGFRFAPHNNRCISPCTNMASVKRHKLQNRAFVSFCVVYERTGALVLLSSPVGGQRQRNSKRLSEKPLRLSVDHCKG